MGPSGTTLGADEGTPGTTDCIGTVVVTDSPGDASGRVAILDCVAFGAVIVENATNWRRFRGR
jgi:hypothetical protein